MVPQRRCRCSTVRDKGATTTRARRRRVELFLSMRETSVGLKSSHFRAHKWLLLSPTLDSRRKVYEATIGATSAKKMSHPSGARLWQMEFGIQMKFSNMGARTFQHDVPYKWYEEELARITRDPLEIPPSACCPEILRTKSKTLDAIYFTYFSSQNLKMGSKSEKVIKKM